VSDLIGVYFLASGFRELATSLSVALGWFRPVGAGLNSYVVAVVAYVIIGLALILGACPLADLLHEAPVDPDSGAPPREQEQTR
jgi:hypothetical protein